LIQAYRAASPSFGDYRPRDDNRKFTDLYKVQRLTSRFITPDSNVCISPIERMCSILKRQELAVEDEQRNPAERALPREPMPVEYNPGVLPEPFDFIIIDGCHRSIYNLSKKVLE